MKLFLGPYAVESLTVISKNSTSLHLSFSDPNNEMTNSYYKVLYVGDQYSRNFLTNATDIRLSNLLPKTSYNISVIVLINNKTIQSDPTSIVVATGMRCCFVLDLCLSQYIQIDYYLTKHELLYI